MPYNLLHFPDIFLQQNEMDSSDAGLLSALTHSRQAKAQIQVTSEVAKIYAQQETAPSSCCKKWAARGVSGTVYE